MGRIESISAGIRHKAWRDMCEKHLSSGMTVIEWYSENGTSKKTFSPSICSNCVAEVFILRRHIQVLYCVIVIERLCKFMLGSYPVGVGNKIKVCRDMTAFIPRSS